jgi:trehalose/maltose hydrolase-like predicted phosphorylase
LARSDRPSSMTFFAEALQSDVADIQHGTTSEGVHLGAMAGTVRDGWPNSDRPISGISA